jgi:hypothetical protein
MVEPSYQAGSPWQNPLVESFNGHARDELFAREIFDSVFEARVLYDDLVRRLQSPSAAQLARLPTARGLRGSAHQPEPSLSVDN